MMVSVIIPAYNVASYIGRTIQSILRQTYADLEVIVVNDGSTDGTGELLAKFAQKDNRIRVFRQQNGGAARARNLGLSKAKGDFIVFVDGDDIISEDFISSNIHYFSEIPDLDWVALSIKRVDPDCNPVHIEGIYNDLNFDSTKIICRESFVPMFAERKLSGVCCGAIYRRSSISMISFPDGEFYEDGFFFTDLLTYTSKGLQSSTGSYYYIHRDNSSQLQKLDRAHLISDYKCSQKRLNQYRKAFPEYEDIYQIWENRLYYYYKNEFVKKTEGAESIFNLFKLTLKRKVPFEFRHELKFLLYRIIGYNNIKQILR